MRKWIIAVIVAGALFAIGALAASFSLTSANVSSGDATVGSCGPNATITWRIDSSGAVVSTTPPQFKIGAADIDAPGCGTATFVLAVKNGASEVHCKGAFPSGGAITNFAINATNCPGATLPLYVNGVTGAALLLGDATIPLTVTSL